MSSDELHTPATIARAVKQACDASHALHGSNALRVRGVVANRGHKGHLYFTLRQEEDAAAGGPAPARQPSLDCVMYQSKVTGEALGNVANGQVCLLYTSPSPRDGLLSRMPSSA